MMDVVGLKIYPMRCFYAMMNMVVLFLMINFAPQLFSGTSMSHYSLPLAIVLLLGLIIATC